MVYYPHPEQPYILELYMQLDDSHVRCTDKPAAQNELELATAVKTYLELDTAAAMLARISYNFTQNGWN